MLKTHQQKVNQIPFNKKSRTFSSSNFRILCDSFFPTWLVNIMRYY